MTWKRQEEEEEDIKVSLRKTDALYQGQWVDGVSQIATRWM